MNGEKLNNLRTFYHSLLEQQRVLNALDPKLRYLETKALIPLVGELKRATEVFSDILPAFNPNEYTVPMQFGEVSYDVMAIKIYTAMILGRLKIAIDQPTSAPVTEIRQFGFITDDALRAIIERDYSEIQRAYVAQCWKSVIILSGGAIETVLTDLLKANEASARASKAAPLEPDITRWDLSKLIEVAVKLNLVTSAVEKLSHSLREYRNLVHPGNELRNHLRFDAEEARIALEVLNIVQRDLLK